MEKYRVIEIKKSVYENNDSFAEQFRSELKEQGVFLLNLMSSPGSGKTTTVMRTIEALKSTMNIGVVEADIDSDVDAETVSKSGVKVIQVHSGGMCHLDAEMTRQGVENLGVEGLDLVILENIGNLICTAAFDTGASKNAMILSVPEGDDKPLKYPDMFEMVDLLLVNKIDAMDFFGFDMEALTERVTKLNPDIKIIPVSARNGDGIDEWTEWLKSEVNEWKIR